MITLYYNPQSRASIAKWMLDECGAEYTLKAIDFKSGENKSPEFLAINPCGKLPALTDGEQTLFENSAIALYLGDRFAEAGLAPALDNPLRGKYLTFVVYATSQLEPAMGDELLNAGEVSPSRGWTNMERAQQVVAQALGDKPYLLGDQFSLADLMVGSMFIYRRMFGKPEELPTIQAYVERLLARPHAQANFTF